MDYPNWFKVKSEDYFTQHLQDFKGKDNLKFLQIGVFTGDGSIWLLDNLLTGRNCTLTDVERWELDADASQESHDWFADVEATYDQMACLSVMIWISAYQTKTGTPLLV